MNQVDPALAIKLVQALHDVVRFAGTWTGPGSAGTARRRAGGQGPHGPEPSLFGIAEGSGGAGIAV